ncbi:hypothetical protein FS837_005507 [Tulasnella sp. UAMH 9824]|nr:hypothetical protein FS837_005507 [Tulasnella sp. UAMH 9824]
MSTFPMQSAPNHHTHFFPPSASSPAPSTSHYHQFPQYWYANSATSTSSFATPSSSPAKRKRDGSFDDQDSSSSDDGGPNYNSSAHRGSHGGPAQRGAAPAAAQPPARPLKRVRREWTSSTDDGASSTGLGGTRPAGMENGFARMSLLNRQSTAASADPPVFVQEPAPIQQQQPVKEVHMKTRSWYEPEKDRIVVLDLDGTDSESESTTPYSSSAPSRSSTPVDEAAMAGSGNGYTISQAYLSRIKGVPKSASQPPNVNPYGSLIIYKPPPNLNSTSFEVGDDDEPLDASHPNYVLPNWGPIPMQDDRPLYASIEEVDDDEDIQMMEVDGN